MSNVGFVRLTHRVFSMLENFNCVKDKKKQPSYHTLIVCVHDRYVSLLSKEMSQLFAAGERL